MEGSRFQVPLHSNCGPNLLSPTLTRIHDNSHCRDQDHGHHDTGHHGKGPGDIR